MRLNRVETSKEPDFPWVFLPQEVPSAKAEPGDSVILAPEHYMERIEIRFVRSDEARGVGFSRHARARRMNLIPLLVPSADLT